MEDPARRGECGGVASPIVGREAIGADVTIDLQEDGLSEIVDLR
jgi:hypothetical protein